MTLTQLLEKVDYELLQGSTDIEISAIVNDSRKVKAGCVFPCIRGTAFDGHKFAAEVAAKGIFSLPFLFFIIILFDIFPLYVGFLAQCIWTSR